jgi:ABC-2 type transport system ATP-binding protein
MDVFHEKRASGKTVILVTHDMGAVRSLCHRAMLIDDGEVKYLGDPEETAIRYYRLNFASEDRAEDATAEPMLTDLNARLIEARIENERGESITNVEQGEPFVLDAVLEARRDLVRPVFSVIFLNFDGVVVFGFTRDMDEHPRDSLSAGERIRLRGTIENALVPGHYYVDCWVRRERHGGDLAMHAVRLLDFVVYGPDSPYGLVKLSDDVRLISDSSA